MDDPCNEVAFATVVELENLFAFGIAQPFQDDLLGCRSRDPSEVLWRIKPFVGDVAVLVEFLTIDEYLPGVRIDGDAGFFSSTRRPLIGRYKGVRQRFENGVARDSLLSFE